MKGPTGRIQRMKQYDHKASRKSKGKTNSFSGKAYLKLYTGKVKRYNHKLPQIQ